MQGHGTVPARILSWIGYEAATLRVDREKVGLLPPLPIFPIRSGYLGLLRDAQKFAIRRRALAKLKDSLAQFEAFEAGRINNRLQVDQARQALFGGQSGLLASKRALKADWTLLSKAWDCLRICRFRWMKNTSSSSDTGVKLVALQEYLGQLLLFIRDPEETPAKEDLEAFGRQAFSMKKEVEESMNGFWADRTLLKEAIPNRKKWYARLRGRSDCRNWEWARRPLSTMNWTRSCPTWMQLSFV